MLKGCNFNCSSRNFPAFPYCNIFPFLVNCSKSVTTRWRHWKKLYDFFSEIKSNFIEERKRTKIINSERQFFRVVTNHFFCDRRSDPDPLVKKWSKIRSKRDLASRVKSDLRSDQKVIVRSLFDLSDQDRHYYGWRIKKKNSTKKFTNM